MQHVFFGICFGFIFLKLSNTKIISREEVCCDLIGCFNKDPPFNELPLPKCLESLKTYPTYNLYTRSNSLTPINITHDYTPNNLMKHVETVFLTHGWDSNGMTDWIITAKNSILERENANVIIIDWKEAADHLVYPQAASNTRTVGAYTALIANNLLKSDHLYASHLWCVGHSLGSHVCGHAGSKSSFGRITGLDPAGPWFENNPNVNIGLNSKCATFVDIIHTDNSLGTSRPLGHIDFYPNGGKQMPGCINSSCSHKRAYAYFIESVSDDCFEAFKNCSDHRNIPMSCQNCKENGTSCSFMGYSANKSVIKTGLMFLETNSKTPYCIS